MRGHEYVHVKHEILYLWQWKQKYYKHYCELSCISPYDGKIKEIVSMLNLKVDHECKHIRPWIVRLGGFNLMHDVEGKMFKAIWKYKMTRQVKI